MEKITKEIFLKDQVQKPVPIISDHKPLSWEEFHFKYLRERIDQLLQQGTMWEKDLIAALQKEGASMEDIRYFFPFCL